METWDVVIIGAGAAGLMCAVEAGRRGRRVLLIDHAKSAGEKIRISGGGRCNFTNLDIRPERFLSQNPRFAVSALARYTQWDFIDLLVSHGISYHEKTLGQLFCDTSAKDVVQMLQRELLAAGVELRLQTSVSKIRQAGGFELQLSCGLVRADALVIATGGKSVPKTGATGFGYGVARQFGLPVIETRPALVPLTFAEQDLNRIRPLAGISVQAGVSIGKTSFEEGLLFTHRGLSGPSILQISSYWREGDALSINLCRREDVFNYLRTCRSKRGRQAVVTALADILPKKLAHAIARDCAVSGNLADQSDKTLKAISHRTQNWLVRPVGSEGYRTAEVTLGGVDTDALDAKTMQAKSVPGLFFVGEVVDVTGWLGGYNFQWAWSSGWAAGQVA
ncbi:MAG: NAD(P)/FAD-dependent oxidoreductase [Rhodobacteraceae bacterium]|nr:NAD(P)/FAD-dependent oxidoreductase [Paracoccaceae bacterium]